MGEPIAFLRVGPNGKMAEDLSRPGVGSRGSARHRHVAGGARVFDLRTRRRMIERFAPHGGLPVRIARRVGHHRPAPVGPDGHVFASRSRQSVVTRKAGVGRPKTEGCRLESGLTG